MINTARNAAKGMTEEKAQLKEPTIVIKQEETEDELEVSISSVFAPNQPFKAI